MHIWYVGKNQLSMFIVYFLQLYLCGERDVIEIKTIVKSSYYRLENKRLLYAQKLFL